MNTEKIIEVLKQAKSALSSCYDVVDYPADGDSPQDHAILEIDLLLTELVRQLAADAVSNGTATVTAGPPIDRVWTTEEKLRLELALRTVFGSPNDM